jgi:hypothetical protein
MGEPILARRITWHDLRHQDPAPGACLLCREPLNGAGACHRCAAPIHLAPCYLDRVASPAERERWDQASETGAEQDLNALLLLCPGCRS